MTWLGLLARCHRELGPYMLRPVPAILRELVAYERRVRMPRRERVRE